MNNTICKVTINDSDFSFKLPNRQKLFQTGLNKINYEQPIGSCTVKITEEYDPAFEVSKFSVVLYNHSAKAITVSQLDLGITIDEVDPILHNFTSGWGNEFAPKSATVKDEITFGSNTGRSCGEYVPFAVVETESGVISLTLGWSGCFHCSITTKEIIMGISGSYTLVEPKGEYCGADIYIAKGKTLDGAALQMRRYFRKYISILDKANLIEMPVEVNSWWPFRDKLINEDVYYKNNCVAKELGCTHSMLDAGWFGEESGGSEEDWFKKRGDWENINTVRFSSGLKMLCDRAEDLGITPGIWCEIEAVGENADLLRTHPELIAKRDGESLGYICFGSPKVRQFAMEVMDRLIGEYGARWIKLDFNLDPAPGCNAENHGHGKGDGLYAHYKGYYAFLDDVAEKYPGVVLENCASGGYRNDIEMLAHTHMTFLSDPDFTEFHLQCFWGVLSYLHQSACLHFSWSDTPFCEHNCGVYHPISEEMERSKFDFIIRAVLMGVPGFSYDFAKFPAWCKERFKEHINFYNLISNDYIRYGDVYRLTAQPIKNGGGERFPAFQFSAANGETIVFAFRLDGARSTQNIKPQNLKGGQYLVKYVDSGKSEIKSAKQICSDGLTFENMPESSSEIVTLTLLNV